MSTTMAARVWVVVDKDNSLILVVPGVVETEAELRTVVEEQVMWTGTLTALLFTPGSTKRYEMPDGTLLWASGYVIDKRVDLPASVVKS